MSLKTLIIASDYTVYPIFPVSAEASFFEHNLKWKYRVFSA